VSFIDVSSLQYFSTHLKLREKMETDFIIKSLEQNQSVFKDIFADIQNEKANWHPAENKWSFLEIACHLYDEELDDFRKRIDYTLNKPGESWPPIDPEGWVKSRDYSSKNYAEVVSLFLDERARSIEWLNNLENPNWDLTYNHPQAGLLTAGEMLANWLAHDYLHIRQLNRYNFLYLKEKSAFKLHYAGDW
jgi:hypothetical protein